MINIIAKAIEIMGLAIMQVPFNINTESKEECKDALYAAIGHQIALMMASKDSEKPTIQEAIQLRNEILSLCNEYFEEDSSETPITDTINSISEDKPSNTITSIRLLGGDNTTSKINNASSLKPLSYKDIAKDIIGSSIFDEEDADSFLSANVSEIDSYLKGDGSCDIDPEVINKVYASCYISYIIQKVDSGNKYRKDASILVLSLFENFVSNMHACYDSECFSAILQSTDKNSIKNANIESMVNCTLISLYKIYLNLVIVE